MHAIYADMIMCMHTCIKNHLLGQPTVFFNCIWLILYVNYYLQTKLTCICTIRMQGRSLTVVQMGSEVDGLVTELLTKPSADCLLIEDLQYAPEHWLKLLPLHIRTAVSTGIGICILIQKYTGMQL